MFEVNDGQPYFTQPFLTGLCLGSFKYISTAPEGSGKGFWNIKTDATYINSVIFSNLTQEVW